MNSGNNPEILRISRLLTPKHRAELLTWVHLAYTAENSARKSLGFDTKGDSTLKPQEHSCSNNF